MNRFHEPATVDAEADVFEWSIVEVFGHRRHAGRALEVERFGAKMLRIDVPKLRLDPIEEGKALSYSVEAWVSHFYGGSSIFSYTPTDETSVMSINRPAAASGRYSLPPPRNDEDEDDYFAGRADDHA